MERKADLRAQLRAARAAMDAAERARASVLASQRVLAWLPATAATVAVYAASGDELDPAAAAAVLHQRGVRVLLPRVVGARIELVQVEAGTALAPGAFGVPEPEGAAVPLDEVDVVVLPGLGFALDGARLGRGGGHYDRLLGALPAAAVRAGLCFDGQVVAHVPTEPHDQHVDVVITDRRTLVAGRG